MIDNFGVTLRDLISKKLLKLLIPISFCFLFSATMYAHSTQVGYCTNNGNVRIYIEHWHGNVTNFSASSVDMTVIIDGMAMFIPNVPASGFVHDTPFSALACSGTVGSYNLMSATCGRENIYNDWAFFDFAIPDCFKEIQVIVENVTDPSFVLLPCNRALYPAASVPVEIVDEDPPNPDCSILTDKLDYACDEDFPPLFTIDDFMPVDDCTSPEDINMTVDDVILTEASCPPGLPTVQRIYTFFDDFNKQSNCIQNLGYKDDDEAPTITCPPALVLECGEDLFDSQIEAWLDSATATDDCTTVTITNNYNPSNINTCSSANAILFTAIDFCDNNVNCRTTLTIRDSQSPEISCPSNIVLECSNANNAAIIENWLSSATATDLCNDNPIITNNYTASFSGGCNAATGTRTVTFTANDDCRNSANTTCTATVTVDDTTPPEFMMKPQDITVECANSAGSIASINAWAAANGNGMATDDCDSNVTWTRVLTTTVPLCGYTESQTYTFTITDDCGNTATAMATATVEDTTPPIMRTRADLSQACSPNNETNLMLYLTTGNIATDACSNNADITIDYVLFSDSEGCGGTSTRVYLFTATDECGNQGTDFFTYTITDTAIPTWADLPGHLDLECGDIDNNTEIQEWIDAIEDAMFDACGGDVFVTNDWDGTFLTACAVANWIEFTLTDECGNSRILNRRLRLLDRMNPVYLNCPSDMTVNVDVDNCGSNVIFSTPIVFDQCSPGLVPTQTIGPASGSSFPVGTTLIRFDVRDNCNRLGRCDFNITVIDSDIPSIDCPSNAVEKCVGAGTCTWTSDDSVAPTTMENCATANITYTITGVTSGSGRGSVEGNVFELGTSTVCYTVRDASNNTASCCFDVVITDCEAPIVICPSDMRVVCDGSGNTAALNAWLATVKATDNCSTNFTFSNLPFNTISGCGEANSTVYQFTGIDESGNSAQCLATFIIEDTTSPIITTAASDGDSDCDNANADLLDWLNNFGYAEATDGCGEVTWSYDFDGAATVGCSGVTEVNVTFIVTDDCGNSSTTSASFKVEDNVAPVISCPSNITLECGDVLNDAVIDLWLQSATATDNCTNPTITYNYPTDFRATCGTTGEYKVTFTAMDDCRNMSDCAVGLLIEDSLMPVFVMKPQDLIVQCGDVTADPSAWLKNNGGAMATDQCDMDLTWDIKEGDSSSDCGDSKSVEYVFIVTDDCGNSASATANYIFEDTTNPTVIPPADITVECGSPVTSIAAWQAGASASDNCGSGFTFEAILFNTISGCGDTNIEVYQFTAVDACGNQGTALASYTIEDTTRPTITCPATLELVCGDPSNGLNVIDWLDSVSGTDACGEVNFTNNFNGDLPDNCGGSVTVAFTATDECGNTLSCRSRITMDDNITPDFVNCPDDITINVDVDLCGSNPIFSTPNVIDNCDVSVAQTSGIASGNTFPVGTTTIEFTATDECGNTEICVFDITVVDSDIPTIACPSNSVIACVDDGTCLWTSEDIGPSSGMENCPSFEISYTITGTTSGTGMNDASGTLFNIGISTVCYTITDDSGNTDSCCFDVQVEDCENPIVNCPTDQTFECDGTGNTGNLITWLASATASDNCDDTPDITESIFNTISDCGGSMTTVYEFVAADGNNNTSVCTASFIIKDRIEPTLDSPAADLTVDCESGSTNASAFIAWLNNNGGAAASDVCSDITWSHNYTEELTELCGETGARTVSFTATDACGNPTTTTAVFRINDTINPVINCPLPITLECGDVANDAVIANWLTTATATDACSEVEITNTFPNILAAGCGDTGTYTVTYTATDDCGNSSTCVSTITIEDTQVPTIDISPNDLIVECSDADNAALLAAWLSSNGGGDASDECSAIVWSNAAQPAQPSCGMTATIPYIFTVTDDCGNTSTAIANYITEDNSEPMITLPTDTTVECDGAGNDTALQAWVASISGSDTCSDDVTTDSELYNTISACGGGDIQIYLFTVTDDCGNQTTGLARFTIEDTTVPIITCPDDLELECGNPDNDQLILQWLGLATATDICSTISIEADYPGALPDDCDDSIIVTFTATDDCGNTSTCTADILMDDTTDPIFVNCPPNDLTINVDVDECGSNPIFSTPIADDNCTVTVEQTAGLMSGMEFPLGSNAVEFTATDGCGNTASCTYNIIVVDSDEPVILCPSVAVVVCTDNNVCTWSADASVEPSANFENCPDAVITYTVRGATTASGNTTAAGVVFNLGESTVCYTITDDSDNSATCCFKVIVEDCQAPNLFCPNDRIFECSTANDLQLNTWLNSAIVSDNCDPGVDLTFEIWNTISGCGNTQTDIYLFTATDNFGNQTTCLRSFEIQDNTAPVISTTVSDVTVECNGNGNIDQFIAWVADNGNIQDADVDEFCNGFEWRNNFATVSFTELTCNDDLGFYQVTFWVVDDCDNISNRITKRFIIEDTEQPVLTVPADITLECGDDINDAVIEAWINDATATDVCDDDIEIAITSVVIDQCGLTSTTTYTYTATDDCGNSIDETSSVIIVDTTDPEILVEASNLILECADGNNATALATWIANNGGAVASDNCSDMALTWTNAASAPVTACGSTNNTSYIFTVTDNCGNTSTSSATVIVEDKTPPVLTVPVDQVEECNDIIVDVSTWLSEATATDDCGTVTIQSELWNTISACGGGDTNTYLFTATDDCGNQSTGLADYTIEDTTDPSIICPTNLSLVCGDENNDQLILSWINSATSSDVNDCSVTEIINSFPGQLPLLDCGGSSGIDITFTVTDACDNSSSCVATITMDDTVVPYFSNCPLDIVVNVDVDLCETNVVYSQPIALDNCDEDVDVTLSSGIASGSPFPLGTTTILYTATDGCGNTNTCSFDITVIDSDVPSISCPSNDVVQCTDAGTCTWTSDDSTDPIYNDNCPGLTVTYTITGATVAIGDTDPVNTVEGDGIIFNIGTSEVCYTITDPSDNSNSCCFDVVIEDCEVPTITCNDQLDIACGSEAVATWAAGTEATAADNCNNNAELTVDMLLLTDFSSCGGTFERVYLFTVTDDAGNQSTCTATYMTVDNVVPVITDASDLTLECNGGPQSTALQAWLANNGGATATDVCSEPITWTNDFVGDLMGTCGTNGSRLVTFTATDDCGNTSTTSATFTIEDTTSPVLDLPADITLECGDDINATVIENWLNNATAEDACESTLTVTNTYPDILVDGCGMTGVHTITFTVTDACDNSSTDTRTIAIEDTTEPDIVLEAQDITLECADPNNATLIAMWVANNGGATATDVCSDEALLWTNMALPELTSCGSTGTTLYTFTVEDNCGNTSTTSASVIIEDRTDPVLTLPLDQVEECGNIVVDLAAWQAEASATDECGNVTIGVILWNTISDCGGTMSEEYLFTATDDCGNQTTGIATYETEDTSIPTVICPSELMLTCGDEDNDQRIANWLESATATDEYGCSAVTISYDYPDGYPDPLSCNGGTGTIVTFTATDECGNTHTCSSVITMDDTEVPYFSNCPLDIVVNVDTDLCETNVVYSQPIALDNCDEDVDVTLSRGIASGSPFPLGTTTILYTATDNCGNTNTCTLDITVIDSDVPSISCPSNDVIQCTDAGTCTWTSDDSTDPIYNDNCPGLTVTYTITGATAAIGDTDPVNTIEGDGIIFNIGTSEVCYTITDPSDNSSSCCFDVVIEDCEVPTITCNDQLDIACGSEAVATWAAGIEATAADNCNNNAELTVDMLLLTDFSSCGGTFERVYLFTVTDEAGNQSTCTATYMTVDNVVPAITDASDLTLECNGGPQSTALQAWLANNGGATATDVCSGPVIITNDFTGDLMGTCGTNGETLVVFTATDDCGNTSTTSATFTIEDTTSPVLDLPANITLECGDDINATVIENWLNNATAEDACESTLTVTNTYPDILVDGCGMTGVHTITFTVTDACDNSSTDTRTITIEDTIEPEIVLEAQDITLECADPNNATLIAMWVANHGGATATDVCSDEALVWTNMALPELTSCGSTGTTLYTFTVEDNCGNTSTTSASVIIEDRTDPVLTLPIDQVEECGNIVVDLAAWQAEAAATDECGNVTIEVILWNTISDCGGTMSEEYLFTATDACGNQATGIATYETEDTSIPTIVCPLELVLTCGDENNDQRILNWLESATATDEYGCSDVTITHDYPSRLPDLICQDGIGTTITFTATDACGNTHTCTSIITMDDSFDPYFSNCPLDIVVNVDTDLCETNVVYSQPIALDNCDENVEVTLTSGIASGDAFPLGTTNILYTATDDCGNTSTCTFDITVIDSDVPSISCPSYDVVQCTDAGTCTWISDDSTDPIYNDNCPGLTVTYTITGATTATGVTDPVNTVEGDGIIFNIGTSEVCYTITDPSDNSSSCCFDVVIEDCEVPTITCNDQLDIACGSEDIATWAAGIEATAADNCNSNAELTVDMLLLTDFSSCGSTFERVYLFTVTDEAGNQSTCIATYETDDNIAPVITDAADLTLECNGGPQSTALQAWLANNGGATATDVCSGPVIITNDFTGDLMGICGTNGETLVVFTATDDCGNTSTTSATFTIEDTTSPVLDLPADITLECGDDINATVIENWLNNATAEDACESTLTVTNTYPDILVDGCGMTGVHTITFTVTDDCDNSSTATRTITIVDTTDPVIESPAQDLTLECGGVDNEMMIADWEANFGNAAASDACSDEALVWSLDSTISLVSCGETGSTLYTFVVTDNCGNTNITTATIIIEDATPPVLVLPIEEVVECNAAPVSLAEWQAEVSGSDICGDVTFTYELWNSISGCGGTYTETYLFTATDACGNETTGFSDYSLEDTTAPIINCPADLVLQCGNEQNDQLINAWLSAATAIDPNNCSDVEIRSTFPDGLPSLECTSPGGIDITFTATDDCGNATTCIATITIDDTEVPYFSNCPIDMVVNVDTDLCETNVVYSQPIALDNCDENVDVVLTSGIASGSPFPLGTTTLLFTATDDCGNTNSCEFDITVIDSDVPSISCPSNDVVQCTDVGTCTWMSDESTDPIYNDNCPGLIVTYTISGATTATGDAAPVNNVADDNVIFIIGLSEVCYTITDPSGNNSSCCFDVIVEDCESPTITCNDQLDIACGSEDISGWYTAIAATAADNCNSNAELTVDTLLLTDFSSCGNTFERVYLFTVTDEAGNQSTCTAIYETDDNVSPAITDASDLTLECNGGPQSTALQSWLNNNAGATATDICSEPITWSNNYLGDLNNSCGNNGSIEVVFTATDDCGNTSITSAMFTIEDTTSPVLDLPADITLECSDDINEVVIENWLNNATAEDACEGTLTVTNTYPDDFVDGCGLTGVTTVTFTVVDACGNSSTDTRTITLEDTTDPIIESAAEDLLLECGDTDNDALITAWESNFGNAVASDVCSDEALVWSILSTTDLEGCGQSGTTMYTFVVEDNCGNTMTTEANVIISDTTPPSFVELPKDRMLECYPSGNDGALLSWLAGQGGAVAEDDCSDTFLWSYDLINVTYDCDDNGTRTYRFYVEDECGNVSSADADFILFDSTPPEINKEAEPFIAECNGSSNAAEILNWLNNNGFAEASDICGNVSWSNDYGSIDSDCGTTGEVLVTFTASDECGNSSTTAATFTINDMTPPQWELEPQDLIIDCDGSTDPMGRVEAWLNTVGGGEAEDDCSLIIYTNNFDAIELECDMSGGVLVTFTATDACGNMTMATAMVSITDEEGPAITTPARNAEAECNGNGNMDDLQIWLDNNGNAVAEDQCSATLTWSYRLVETIENCGLTETHTYAFTASDECGNNSLETLAEFIINDVTIPAFDVLPTDMVVECNGEGNDAELDNWLDNYAGLVTTDICSEIVSIEYDLVTEEDSCGITGIQVYRFTITDGCDNTDTAEATFTIEDTTSPDIVGGENMLMEECDVNANTSFEDFDFWRESHAGATATDDCGIVTWTDDYDPANWETICGNTRFIDITYTATDDCNNSSSITHRFGIGDVTPPTFVNCPRPPVVVDAPDGWCSSFVNFSQPVAEDNCSGVTLTRTDLTGLESGDLFAVGLTLLTYVAEDACGNTSTCELKIIVNDFHTPPTIECPESITVSSDGKTCGAIVNGIAPVSYEDNCPNNLAVLYEITDAADNTVDCGVEDASGYLFPIGDHKLTYSVIDQPVLLITEVIQNGSTTGIEITNFGPASLDISCLDIVREGPDSELYNVPNGTVISVGDVYTQLFTEINPASAAGYYISFVDRVIDGVSINGYAATDYTYSGSISGDNIYRQWICDHDNAGDFISGSSCFSGNFGETNPMLPFLKDNGTTVGLQGAAPSMASCSLDITVEDIEAPFCAEYDSTRYELDLPLAVAANSCTEIIYNVNVGITAGDINVLDIAIEIADAGDISLSLTSPNGTTINLFNNLCGGTSDIDISLDDMSDNALSTITCNPLGGGEFYQAIGDLLSYYGEDAGGDWIISIQNDGDTDGIINSATLEVLELVPFAQDDVVINNDPGQCGALFTWRHPLVSDNCSFGMGDFRYETTDEISLPPSGDFEQGELITSYFEVGTTTVIYTMTDAAGNKSQCSFDVSVNDGELPLVDPLSCVDQVVQLQAGQCVAPASALTLPLLSDNCGNANLTSNLETSGLTAGFHEMQLFYADAAGNVLPCEFSVTVLPFEPAGNQINCLGNVNLSLGPDCMEQITAEMMLGPGGEYGCVDDFCITLIDEDGQEIGNSTDGTNIVDEAHIGQYITVRVCFDCTGGNCCWGEIFVESKLIPDVVCPPDVTISCNQIFLPTITGEPAVESCEQEIYFSYEDNFTSLGMCEDPSAVLERTWYVTDESNNVIECVQNITITSFDINDVVIPADTILTSRVTCEDVVLDPSLTHPDSTGWAMIMGVPISETGDGLCSHFYNWDDQILYNCVGSYEILRKWIIRDMCEPIVPGINPIERFQSIKVLDNMPPQFTDCPTDITVSSTPYDCTADVLLNDYFPEITELCGSIKDTLITVTPGSVTESPRGQYYLTNLSAGMHTVKITVRDQCSNFNRCTFDINVVDSYGPNVVCNQDMNVSLSSTGIAELRAEIFDDGSFDNCTGLDYQVLRMTDACGDVSDLEFGESVKVCCADVLNSPIQVMLRVWDDADADQVFGTAGDYFGECMVRVFVTDFPLQQFNCPDDITITCTQDYNNINLTGAPANSSICNIEPSTYEDELELLSDCSTGRILRTWTVDATGQQCKQTISLQAAEPFTIDNIIWPADFEGDCADGLPNDEPVLDIPGCAMIGISVESDTFYFAQNVCFKILNTWTVIDWCQRPVDALPGDTTGMWTYEQEIKITESEGPVIVSCDDYSVDILTEDCILPVLNITHTATDNSCGLVQDVDWTYQIDADGDGSYEVDGSDQSDALSVSVTDVSAGEVAVVIGAFDGCGNSTACTYSVTVEDRKAPTAACVNLTASVMPSNGQLQLWVADFNASSSDNCTAPEDLILSFDQNTVEGFIDFDCSDIPNGVMQTVSVDVWVTDAAGNQSVCTAMIELQDNNGACQDTEGMMAIIAGTIETENTETVEEVETYLTMGEGEDYMDITESDGRFAFENMPQATNYLIRPVKNINFLNGVTTFDILLIQSHILRDNPFDSPYKIIAADATGDASVSALDLIELRRLILGSIDTFSNNTSWRFVDSDYKFLDTDYPFPFDEVIIDRAMQAENGGNDFVGVKIGDVNSSVNLSLKSADADQRDNHQLYYDMSVESAEAGTLIPIYSNDNGLIHGFQFTLEATGLSPTRILPGSVDIQSDNYVITDNGHIHVSWQSVDGAVSGPSTPLFYIDVDQWDETNKTLSLIEQKIAPEIYIGSDYITKVPVLSTRSSTRSDNYIMYQNEPNPFVDKTEIKVYLPKAQNVRLEIFDAAGKLLYSIERDLLVGESSIEIDAKNVGGTGIMYYSIVCDSYSDTKKMIIVE